MPRGRAGRVTETVNRRRHASRFLGQIAYAVRIEGTKVVTQCGRCGHEHKTEVDTEFAAKKYLNWWSKEHGGCAAFCKRCDK
jgi:hypothetical protein